MQFDFENEMKKRTDQELIQIITIDRNDYLPEALTAAEAELKIRNLNQELVGHVTRELTIKKERVDKKANEALDPVYKILTFLFPMIFTFVLSGFYKANGYDKKANELARWTLYGYYLYIALIVLYAFFNAAS